MKDSRLLGSHHALFSPAGESAGGESAKPSGGGPIVLYCDLAVNPEREQEMLHHFHQEFKPAAERFDGYIDVKIVRLRKVIQGGPAPADKINFRFQLTYESEEKRQLWIASEVHARVWALIENTLIDKGYLVLLTDSM